jgi:N4-gp56 family major capsid protein
VPQEILSRAGRQVAMPRNQSDTYVARRWLPYGGTTSNANTINRFFQDGNGADRATSIANAHLTAEGVTPTPDSITPQDTTVVLQQYSCLYGFTDKTFYLYEDNIPDQMAKQVGERVTFVNEMIIYGALKACTNVYYGGTGSSVGTVNGALSLGLIQKVVMNLQANHAMPVTSVLKASGLFGTDAVSAGYLVYCHTDLEPDIRALPDFTPTEKYASGTPMENEIGKCQRFRFIGHPDLPSVQNGGAAVGSTNLYSTSGTSLDVYPMIVVADNAWSQIAVRGLQGNVNPTFLPPGEKSKADPLGQRGYAGTAWWKAIMIENHGWMSVVYVGRKNLPV